MSLSFSSGSGDGDRDGDAWFFSAGIVLFYTIAAFNVLCLPFISLPYGKYVVGLSKGPTFPAGVAWLLFESPTLWLSLLLYPLGRHRHLPLSLLVLSLYLLHYSHRTLVYPLRLKKSQPVPVMFTLYGFLLNLLNVYIQTRSLSHYAEAGWNWIRVSVGTAMFLWGMWVNVRSDLALMRLKKEGSGYKIPRGGWFEWVCSPNYMGEAVEWLGWAVVAGFSPATTGFFLFTCSNLVPRARTNLRWYREKFGSEFPRDTKAIVPLLY